MLNLLQNMDVVLKKNNLKIVHYSLHHFLSAVFQYLLMFEHLKTIILE